MTLELANKILTNDCFKADATPLEQALLALIKDLQVRHVVALGRIEKLEESNDHQQAI